jgi:hypothetical protein
MTSHLNLKNQPFLVVLIQTHIDEQRLNGNCVFQKIDDFRNAGPNCHLLSNANLVIAPLFTLKFDAIDIGQSMSSGAKLRLVSQPLPRPRMVLREISEACPEIDIDFLDTRKLADLIPKKPRLRSARSENDAYFPDNEALSI